MAEICATCGQERILRRGDIVQLRDGRLGIVSDWHSLQYRTRFVDVVILAGKNKGITTICDSIHLVVVHGYFHINRRGR